MKRSIAIIATIVIIIGGFVISNLLSNSKKPIQRRPQKHTMDPVKVVKVQNKSLRMTFKIGGYISAFDKVELFAEVSGVLLNTPKRFKEGTRFEKDEVLIHIDDAVYKNNVLAQKSSLLNQLTLLLPDLSIDFPDNAKRWENYLHNFDLEKPLYPLPDVSSDQEKYYIASRNIYSQFYTIKGMEATLAKYTLEAPYRGAITMSNINQGTLVRMGQKLGEFTNTDLFELEATANVFQVGHLNVGDEVLLSSEDLPDIYTGRIERINDVIDPKYQSIKVYISTRDKRLKDGMFLEAEIVSNPIPNAIQIETTLLIGKDKLYTITQDSTLALVTINKIAEENGHTIVTGLKDGTLLLGQKLATAQEGKKIEHMAPNGKKQKRVTG